MSWRFHASFAAAATAVVAFAIAWGFMLVGSPSTRRVERFDEQRLQDLQTIAREIHGMTVEATEPDVLKAALPKTLQEAALRARNERLNLNDPQTGDPYRYTVKNETTFEVCATFSARRDSDRSVFWNHDASASCFTIDVLDPPPFY